MRIALDARAYSWTGIGTYTRNLLRELLSAQVKHDFIVFLSQEDRSQFEKDTQPFASNRLHIVEVEESYYSWREQFYLWRQLERIEADLFHFTHFNVPALFSKPYIVTIHDVTRFIFPGQKKQTLVQQLAYEYLFVRTVNRARRVITVSDSTRSDLLSLPQVSPPSISTIHEGIDPLYLEPIRAVDRTKVRMLLGTNVLYLLFVGVWVSHKNLERLLRAFKDIRGEQPGLKLVVTGRPKPGYHNLLPLVSRLGLEEDVIFPGHVPIRLMPALYAESELFVFPSLYEGFGLPALEAAAVGTPVVASNLSSLPEVLESAAEYVNPESIPSIAEGIRSVLTSAERQAELRAHGKDQAGTFSWETAARVHLEVYKAALTASD